jgi:uncharacterized phage protein (TIGR02218 family)
MPIECYFFAGTVKNYLYTSADTDVSIGTDNYKSTAIERSELKVSTHSDDRQEITLSMPTILDVIQDYAFSVAPPDLTLTIRRFHRGTDSSANNVIYWIGQVSSMLVNGHGSQILVPSIMSNAMKNNIPPVSYQTPCNHVLFDARCKVDRPSHLLSTTVAFIGGRNITMGDAPGVADGVFITGEVFCARTNEHRQIQNHAGRGLLINYPFSKVVVGDAIQVTWGCDHSFSTCVNKFGNQLNFGGFPYVPNINPFVYGI